MLGLGSWKTSLTVRFGIGGRFWTGVAEDFEDYLALLGPHSLLGCVQSSLLEFSLELALFWLKLWERE